MSSSSSSSSSNYTSKAVVVSSDQDLQAKTGASPTKPRLNTLKWVHALLQISSRENSSCDHLGPKNELNRFCIDCESAFWQHYENAEIHSNHQVLKIYRHFYKDAILLSELDNYFDCSDIQYYKCNHQKVIVLEARSNGEPTHKDQLGCEICQWRLMDPELHKYCSLSCKMDAYVKKDGSSMPPFLFLANNGDDDQEKVPKAATLQRRHRRKGIPHRAPTRTDDDEPCFLGTINYGSGW